MKISPEAPSAERAPRVPIAASSERSSVSESVCVHARPHPGPLPQERENRSTAPCVFKLPCCSFAFYAEQAVRSDRPFDSRIIRAARLLSPLPGGEGQGEGEHLHINFPVRSEPKSKETVTTRETSELSVRADSSPLSPGESSTAGFCTKHSSGKLPSKSRKSRAV